MRTALFILSLIVIQTIGCSKTKQEDNCTAVIITNSGFPCNEWGIEVNGVKYPSANIPAEFQQNGITVCAVYQLYEDMRACACCGGTWANIKSMKRFIR